VRAPVCLMSPTARTRLTLTQFTHAHGSIHTHHHAVHTIKTKHIADMLLLYCPRGTHKFRVIGDTVFVGTPEPTHLRATPTPSSVSESENGKTPL
jgi:hypothetical protein